MGQTFVVVAHHGLGDLLMTVPLLRACDAALTPEDRLVVLVRSAPETAPLADFAWRSTLVARPLDRRRTLGVAGLAREALSLRRDRPAVLLAPHATPGPSMAVFAKLIGAKSAVGPAGAWSGIGFDRVVHLEPGMHKVRYYLRFGEEAGIPVVPCPDVSVPVSPAARQWARARLGGRTGERWVGIAPGSGLAEAHKRWPLANFCDLLSKLVAYAPDVRIGLIGTPAERQLLEALIADDLVLGARCAVFAEADSRMALALLTHFACLVTACSGAGHMAAAVDVPIVGLFGPTNPGHTGPFSRKLHVVRRGLPCSPCYRRDFIHGCGTPACMASIETDEVLAAVRECLAGVPAAAAPWCPTTNATSPADLTAFTTPKASNGDTRHLHR